jgi:putative transposase
VRIEEAGLPAFSLALGLIVMNTMRKSYSDLIDLQWSSREHLFRPKPGSRTRRYDNRDLANAGFYLLRTGCACRALPHDFPPCAA